MGLDQYMYVASKAGQYDEFYETAEFDAKTSEFVSKSVTKPFEIGYRRKHPNLHGWMEQLWISKGKPGTGNTDADFNGIELELTWDDLDDLERAIRHSQLPDTSGFFFGDPSDEYYKEHDLKFCSDAKAELFLGLKVFYNSSW